VQKVIIAGGRDFERYDILVKIMKAKFHEPIIIVSGGANGADKLGERYAREYGYQIEHHPAEWDNLSVTPCYVKHNSHGPYNALAGHNRNKKMLQAVLDNPDGGCLVAFWNGKSSGTRNMINIAREAGISVHVIGY
jgi:hypothetical protein